MRRTVVTYLLCGFFWGMTSTIAQAQTPASVPTVVPTVSLEAYLRNGAELQQDAKLSHITFAELVQALNSKNPPRLVDVRSPSEFARQRLRGAINLPEADLVPEKLQGAGIKKDTPLVIYCSNSFFPVRMIALTNPAYSSLRQLGYQNVRVLDPVWREKGARTLLPEYLEGEGKSEILSFTDE
jgi:3-mercaptopyruvate sulfurtransferase SseA